MSEWEDSLNETVAAGIQETMAQVAANNANPTTGFLTLGGNGQWAQPVMAEPQTYATPVAPPDYPPPATYGGADVNRATPICGTNNHYFECRHELRCSCGQVERLPLQVPEGL